MLRSIRLRRSRARSRRDESAVIQDHGASEILEDRTLLSGHTGAESHPHAAFAPGTPKEYVLANSDTPVSDPNAFQLNSRWSTTATNGGGLGQGDPTILTWSIVPDGTSIPALGRIAGESTDASDLVAFLGGIYGVTTNDTDYTDEPWFPLFESVFARWSELSGITYVYEPNDDGAAFTAFSGSAPGVLGTRGDARIGGHFIDGNSGVLAYNFYPNHGEMVIDTADNFYSNTNSNSIRLRNVLAHEAGHGIGIRHVESNNAAFLMEPFINTSFNGPQFDDILSVHRHYGDALEDTAGGNDTFGTATPLGTVVPNSSVIIGTDGDTTDVAFSEIDFLSIDDNSDADYFSFTLLTTATINVILDPVGPTYNEGPQGGSQSSLDAQALGDLTLELLDSNGTTVLMTANANEAGASEVIGGLPLEAGTFFVRVSGSSNAAQLYRLTVENGLVSPTGSIAGIQFHDLNSNGFRDVGEPGLEGWTIYIDQNGNGVFDNIAGGVEPDDFPEFTILDTINPDVTLSEMNAAGNPTGVPIDGFDGAFASTGVLTFRGTSPVWSQNINSLLRMDFHVNVSTVSIDAISDDSSDFGVLEIYDAADNLLDTHVTADLGTGVVETMTLSSSTPIAYAIAYGQAGQTIFLDHLVYSGVEPSTTTDADGSYSFLNLPNGTYRLGEVPQAEWTPTAPQYGRLFAAVAGTNEILEIDPTTGVELNRFSHPGVSASGADGLAFNGTSLFFSDRVTLFELNPNDGTVLDMDTLTTMGVGSDIDGLGFYGGQLVASNLETNEVFYIDPATDMVTSVVALDAGIDAIGGLTGAPSRHSLFLTDLEADLIYEVDAATGAALISFPVTLGAPNEFGLAFINGSLFVGDTNGDLKELDPDTGDLIVTIGFGLSNDFSALGGDGGTDGFRTVYVGGQNVTDVDFGNRADTGPTATALIVNAASNNRSGINTLTMQFDESVAISGPDALVLFNHTTGSSVVVGGATLSGNGTAAVTWNLNSFNLPDGYYTAELPAGESAPILDASAMFVFWKLSGDIDGDAVVNFNDTVPLSVHFGATGLVPYSDGDANGDGDVNFDDTVPLSLNFGASLTPPLLDFGFAPQTEVEDDQIAVDDMAELPVEFEMVQKRPDTAADSRETGSSSELGQGSLRRGVSRSPRASGNSNSPVEDAPFPAHRSREIPLHLLLIEFSSADEDRRSHFNAV